MLYIWSYIDKTPINAVKCNKVTRCRINIDMYVYMTVVYLNIIILKINQSLVYPSVIIFYLIILLIKELTKKSGK